MTETEKLADLVEITELSKLNENSTFEQLMSALLDFAVGAGLRLLAAALILFVGMKLVGVIMKRIGRSALHKRLDANMTSFFDSLIKLLLYAVLVVAVASLMGVPMTSVITLIGAAGLAVGLALQGSLANIAGGFIICIFKPFTIGDYITSGDLSGTVESMNIFYTTLRTPDNRRITAPNAALSNSAIIDVSAYDNRRIDFVFSVGYESDLDLVRKTLLDTARANPLVLADPAPMAVLSAHGDSALSFTLRVWCAAADYWTVNFDLLESVKRALDAAGIEIPYPQLDVHMKG